MVAAEVLGQERERRGQLRPLQVAVDRGRAEELELERLQVRVAVLAQPVGRLLRQLVGHPDAVPGDREQLRVEGVPGFE